jgi:hypothetical protein
LARQHVASDLQVFREEGDAALPAVLGRLLLVHLRPVIREEGVGGAGVQDELDVGVRLRTRYTASEGSVNAL